MSEPLDQPPDPRDEGGQDDPSTAETLSADLDSRIPRPNVVIEGYDVVRELHRGGQGIVYQAVQCATKRKVAIKVLLEGAYATESAKKRFEREIEVVAGLKHANIVAVFDSGTTSDGRQYCVMEYVRGKPLDQYVRERKLSLEEALKVFASVCEAVQYAHQRGVIHRDLKPSNILVDTEGKPRVMDFGLAKWSTGPIDTMVSVTGQVIGTLPYMSPEQSRGEHDSVDTRTDVYALGVILYQLLTGQFPYPVVGQLANALRNISEMPPLPPKQRWRSDSGVTRRAARRFRQGDCPIDDDVQTIVLKTLAKEPDRRYQSAGDLARDVRRYLAGEPIEARGASMLYMLRHWFKQNVRSAFWVVVIGLVCGLVGSGALGMLTLRTLMDRLANTYDKFPSETPPFLAVRITYLPWLDFVCLALGPPALLGMGFLVAWVTRPRNRAEDIVSGLGAGLVAGISSFALAIGWAAVLALSVSVVIGRLASDYEDGAIAARMAAGIETDGKELEDLWDYRDLADIPVADRPRELYPIVIAEMVAGIQMGIWLGLVLALGGLGGVGVAETMAAGYLLRRGDRFWPFLWYYTELSVAGFAAWVAPLVFCLALLAEPGDAGVAAIVAVAAILIAAIAVNGIRRGWNLGIRFGTGGVISVLAFLIAGPPGGSFWIVLAWAGGTGALLFLGLRFQRRSNLRRQLIEAGDPACAVCGYDLRGQVVARCPECGNDFSSRLVRRETPHAS